MAVRLTKPTTPVREVTPVHLIDEEETIQRAQGISGKPQTAIMPVEEVQNTKGISAERSKNPDDILYADWDSDEDFNEDLLDARLLDAMRLIADELPNADVWVQTKYLDDFMPCAKKLKKQLDKVNETRRESNRCVLKNIVKAIIPVLVASALVFGASWFGTDIQVWLTGYLGEVAESIWGLTSLSIKVIVFTLVAVSIHFTFKRTITSTWDYD